MVPSPEIQLGFLDGIALWVLIVLAIGGGLLLSGGFLSLAFALWFILILVIVGIGWIALKRGFRYLEQGRQTTPNNRRGDR